MTCNSFRVSFFDYAVESQQGHSATGEGLNTTPNVYLYFKHFSHERAFPFLNVIIKSKCCNREPAMFDEQTGQVFEETIVGLSRTNDRNWHTKVPTSLCQKFRPPQGHAYENYCKNVEQNRWPRVRRSARPLLGMSISVFVSNLHRLPSDVLMQLPPHLLYEIGKAFPERFPELEALGRVPHDIFERFPLTIVEEIWTTVNQRSVKRGFNLHYVLYPACL